MIHTHLIHCFCSLPFPFVDFFFRFFFKDSAIRFALFFFFQFIQLNNEWNQMMMMMVMKKLIPVVFSVTIQSQCLFWNTLQIKQNSDKQTKKNYTKILSTKKKGEKISQNKQTASQPAKYKWPERPININIGWCVRSTHFSFI